MAVETFIAFAGALLYMALALAFLRYSAGRRANAALAIVFLAFAINTGAEGARNEGIPGWRLVYWLFDAIDAPLFAWAAALILAPTWWLPAWGLRPWPYALATVLIGAGALTFADPGTPFRYARLYLDIIFAVVPLLLVARAFRQPERSGASDILLATGIGLWWSSSVVAWLPPSEGYPIDVRVLGGVLTSLYLILTASLVVGATKPSPLRSVFATGAVLMTIAILIGLPFGWDNPLWPYVYRATYNIAAPLLVSYAALRHDLLGLDRKVRWTISRSTIAAAFVAVFFIASEAAQQFFGDTSGSTYIGIVAAGGLVFALAPLSRLADRIAQGAVPVSAPIAVRSPSSGVFDRERAYRTAVRGYLGDGVLTREEERELAHLAGELGIHAGRAMELRHEIEDHRTRE